MTARHPNDCYLTTAEVAYAVHLYLRATAPEVLLEPWLDPFGAAGRFVSWVLGGLGPAPLALVHAWDLDVRWRTELAACVLPVRSRLGVDSFVVPWSVGGRPVNVCTNYPFGRDEAVQRLHDHARTHGRWALTVMRTDWWQHPGRFEQWRPDAQLQLGWRPAFGFSRDKKTGRLTLGTDRFTGYTVSVWRPLRAPVCELAVLPRPEVPRAMRDEHRRLARIAYDMAHGATEDHQGA